MTIPARERPPFIVLPRNIGPLGYGNYLAFWLGMMSSNTGRWIELTGSVWLMYELTGSPVLLGLLGVARALPAFVFAPIAGVVADRVDQRRMLVITQGLGLVTALTLGLLILSGHVQFWHVYVQVAVQAVINSFDVAVRQALFPRLVPRAILPEAVTLHSTAARTSGLLGPAIGGIAIARLGEAAPFLLNAASFLALMGAVSWISGVAPRKRVEGSTFRGELSEGLRFILGTPVLSSLLQLEIVFSLLQMNPVMITLLGREVLGVSAEQLGGLLSAPALGALLGIGLLLVFGHRQRQGRFVIACTFVYAGALLFAATTREYAAMLVGLALCGCLDAVMGVTRHSVMQLSVPGRMRGRVMGNMGTVTRGVGPLAQTQSGILAAAIGAPLALVAAAAGLVVSAALVTRSNRTLWHFSREEVDPTASGPQRAAIQLEPPSG